MFGINISLTPANSAAITKGGLALRIAATLGRVSGANADGGDGTNTQALSRTVHRTGRWPVMGLRIVDGNFKLPGVSPFGEVGLGNAITVQSEIEYAGANTVARWAGSTSISVADLSIAISDSIINLPAGDVFYVRHWTQAANTTQKWGRAQTITQNSQRAVKGTDLTSYFTSTGALVGGSTDAPRPPIALVGYVPKSAVAVAYTGDSIADNTGDNPALDTDGTVGFVGRGLLNVNGYNLAHSKLSRSGERLQNLASNGALRFQVCRYATHYICELGVNDINAGRTLAQMQADYLTTWAAARAAGIQHITRTTLTPQTNSSDAWATLANQTTKTGFEPGGVRDQLNAWFPTKVADGTIDAVCDVAAVCQDATTPWKWRVDLGTPTVDGTHPEAVLHTAMAGVLNTQAATWTAY